MRTEPRTRVLAIRNGDAATKTLYIYGAGIYVGDERPPNGTRTMFGPVDDDYPAGLTNPRIDLDRGGTVWGCQCWWGPEETARARWKDFEFVEVPRPDEESDEDVAARRKDYVDA